MGVADPRARRDSRVLRGLRAVALAVRLTVADFVRDRGVERSAALSYVTLLSLVPLLATATALYGAFFPTRVEALIATLTSILPYAPERVAETLAEFVGRTSALSAVGSLLFLVIAFRLFLSIESVFNDIWGVTRTRTPAVRMFSFTMLVFWGPVVMGVVATVMVWIPVSPLLERVLEVARELMMLLGLTMVYRLAPHTTVKVGSAVAGGLMATVGLMGVRWAITCSVRNFTDLNVIYGSLALVVTFLVSLFAFWMVVILGAEAAFVVENFTALAARHHGLSGLASDQEAVGLAILVEVYGRTARGEPSPTPEALAAVLGIGRSQVQETAEGLVSEGLLGVTGEGRERFVPGRRAADLDLAEASEAVVGVRAPRYQSRLAGTGACTVQLGRVLDDAEAARRAVLAGTRLSMLVDRE